MSDEVREQVRSRYAAAATAVAQRGNSPGCGGEDEASQCCGPQAAAFEDGESFGSVLYAETELDGLPAEAVAASLGCGNPLAVAALRPGERVLDLGSGGGIDVLLSAQRVGPTGKAYGLDMTEEMLDLARANAARAGAPNVEFLRGQIEAIPLPAASVDVVISNCVVNLSTDKPAVLAEMFRVLSPGGRIGVSDVVAEDDITAQQRAERGSYVGCIAGALSRGEYLSGLTEAGFVDATVDFTHEAAPGMHGAVIRATKPTSSTDPADSADVAAGSAAATSKSTTPAPAARSSATACCSNSAQATCDGSVKDGRCRTISSAAGASPPATCGCR